VLSHTARGTLRPTQEDSLQERFKNWTYLATDLVPYRPLGIGSEEHHWAHGVQY